ncbi:hypothetical protein JEQ12_013224, partial [Ovis aries]
NFSYGSFKKKEKNKNTESYIYFELFRVFKIRWSTVRKAVDQPTQVILESDLPSIMFNYELRNCFLKVLCIPQIYQRLKNQDSLSDIDASGTEKGSSYHRAGKQPGSFDKILASLLYFLLQRVSRCPNEFTGDRCQNYVMASFYKAEELYQKRVLTITGICIALLVVGIMCVVAYCKTKKQRKKLHDRLRQSLRSERNTMMNVANGPHHPNPPPENVQLVNQYVSKNVISSEHIVEREAETSFSTSHYTSTAHHSTTVTQTPSHSWSNGHTESIISESHSVIVMSSVENSRHSSPTGGPRGRLNGLGGPRECNSFLRHARETPDSYRDSPHSERYVSAMTTPARMSPVDFHTPSSPKSPPSEMSPPVSSTTVSMPSMAISPFVEEERPLLLVTPPRLREKYDHQAQQFSSFHCNPAHESNSLPPSPLRIVEDEEYETTQEYEPAQEPVKKLTNSSRRAKRTKPNGHIAHRLEMDNTGTDSSNSESETEDERVGEDTPFLAIQNPLAASLEAAPAFRLVDSRTNPTGRFSPQEELQARLSGVIANQDPIAV